MKTHIAVALTVALAVVMTAQQSDVLIKITQGERTAIAVPDFRASGDAQKFMDAFNQTLFGDLDSSGLFRMVPKSMYPLETPQRPQDFRPPVIPTTPSRRGAPPPQPVRQGPWLTDWSQPPVSATYLAFGYAGEQDGRLVVFGWLYNVTESDLTSAQALGKLYLGSLDEAGARKTAHDFAADILALFGYKSLAGTKIYFESNRSGNREIWSMDPDGSNQKQLSFYKAIAMRPAVSPDGTMLAYTTSMKTGWMITVQSLVTGGRLPFFNPPSTLNQTPDFTPDGKKIVFSSNVAGRGDSQLYMANVDGGGLQRLTYSNSIERRAAGEPEDRRPNRLRFRPIRHAADLQHEHRRDGRAEADQRRGRRGQPGLAPGRPAHCVLLDAGLRPGTLQRLFDGRRDPAVRATHARDRAQRKPVLGAGRAPFGVFLQSGRRNTDLDHARGWNATAKAHHSGQQHEAGVEIGNAVGVKLEVREEARSKMNKRKISLILLGFTLFLAATGCKKKVAPPPPPPPPKAEVPPPPPPPKPSITQFVAEPSTIQRGQSATLRWNVSDATDISINQSIGAVQAQGTRQVFPNDTTTYTLTVKGPGGADSRSATVSVTVPPPPPPPPPPKPARKTLSEMLSTEVQDAYFDYDKSDIREDARAVLTSDATALKTLISDYPSGAIVIEGNCDERGSAEYNLGLGDRRASSARDFLVQLGVPADRLKTISYGKERPVCTESNEDCWQKNRHVHFSSGE